VSAVHQLEAAVEALAVECRQVRWQLRRLEAAKAAAVEALSLVRHDPVLQALSATTDEAVWVDSTDPFHAPAPAAACGDVVAAPDNTPDIVPAVEHDDQDDGGAVAAAVGPVQRRRRAGGPDWQAIADVIAAHRPEHGPLQVVLQRQFNAPKSGTKNWPRKITDMGIIGDPSRAPHIVATPRPPAGTRMVRAVMCTSCDTWIPVSEGNAAVKLAHHIRHAHDRAITRPEQTPVDVPIDTEAAS
jgi:hypothetical protein